MKTNQFVAAVLFALCSTHAEASLTGQQLLGECRATPGNVPRLHCAAYIEGFIAGWGIARVNRDPKVGTRSAEICIPTAATVGQLVLVVAKYLDDNPALLHQPAPLLIMEALAISFPCIGQTSPAVTQ